MHCVAKHIRDNIRHQTILASNIALWWFCHVQTLLVKSNEELLGAPSFLRQSLLLWFLLRDVEYKNFQTGVRVAHYQKVLRNVWGDIFQTMARSAMPTFICQSKNKT